MSITDGSAEYSLKTTPSYDELGYRQKNKTYNVGDIAYHKDLPVGYYLRCTTAGTTSNNDLTITNNTKGIYFNDGTVTWNISDIKLPGFSMDLLHYIVTSTNVTPSDLNMTYTLGFYRLVNNTLNNPTNDYGFCLVLSTSGSADLNGYHMQIVWGINNHQIYYRTAFHQTEGVWNDWKRIPTTDMLIQKVDTAQTGYIQFGSLFGGLTIQWIRIGTNNPQGTTDAGNNYKIIDLPISFIEKMFYSSCTIYDSNNIRQCQTVDISGNDALSKIRVVYQNEGAYELKIFAIGC